MARKKIKLTKGEIKRQRDSLAQYERYLPTLQLKQKLLQIELRRVEARLASRRRELDENLDRARGWVAVLAQPGVDLSRWTEVKEVRTSTENVAGVDIPVFVGVDFAPADYDLFLTPLWTEKALESIRELIRRRVEISTLERRRRLLYRELRITLQRVNLFEKVMIPECREKIRVIRIYLGDQDAAAVGRSKIAKKKIEHLTHAGAARNGR